MLIKEYRCRLPLTLEEYRVGQLYTIATKTVKESKGEGSGVEIMKNEPYGDGPGGKGQYTLKCFHLTEHVPRWARGVFGGAEKLVAYEEGWNAFPYTKTTFTSPLLSNFSLVVETIFREEAPDDIQENVFELSGKDFKSRQVEWLDILDPCIKSKLVDVPVSQYHSDAFKRGPLEQEWWKKKNTPHMVIYKLCKVEFKYFGLQGSSEKFIHDRGLRPTLSTFHQELWIWSDQWAHMDMAQVREYEKKCQGILNQKMHDAEQDERLDKSQQGRLGVQTAQFGSSGRSNASIVDTMAEVTKKVEEDEYSEDEDEEFFDALEQISSTNRRKSSGLGREVSDKEEPHHHVLLFYAREAEPPFPGATFRRNFTHSIFKSGRKAAADLVTIHEVPISVPSIWRQWTGRLRAMGTGHSGHFDNHSRLLFIHGSPLYTKLRSHVDECVREKVDELSGVLDKIHIVAYGLVATVIFDALTDDSFEVESFFAMGNSIGTLLEKEKLMKTDDPTLKMPDNWMKPRCTYFYNIAMRMDFSACRLEPAIDIAYAHTPAVSINQFLLGNVIPATYYLTGQGSQMADDDLQATPASDYGQGDESPASSIDGSLGDLQALQDTRGDLRPVWGLPRVDFFLDCPSEEIMIHLNATKVQLIQGMYYESHELARFIAAQILDLPAPNNDDFRRRLSSVESSALLEGPADAKWNARTSSVISRYGAVHRIYDEVCRPDGPQFIRARFGYSTLDSSLSKEYVDVYISSVVSMTVPSVQMVAAENMLRTTADSNKSLPRPTSNQWTHIGRFITNSDGTVDIELDDDQRVAPGLYYVRAIVSVDQSMAEGRLFCLEPMTQFVAFSIDKCFIADRSIKVQDPKLRAGSVDFVRQWTAKGFLPMYVTNRPSQQTHSLSAWMTRSGFPCGVMSFAHTFTRSRTKGKMPFLQHILEEGFTIAAAYGSVRDVRMYYDKLEMTYSQLYSITGKDQDDTDDKTWKGELIDVKYGFNPQVIAAHIMAVGGTSVTPFDATATPLALDHSINATMVPKDKRKRRGRSPMPTPLERTASWAERSIGKIRSTFTKDSKDRNSTGSIGSSMNGTGSADDDSETASYADRLSPKESNARKEKRIKSPLRLQEKLRASLSSGSAKSGT
eukprot:Clim_evm37s153 gene=Clim_evmTU37s153